MASSPFERQVIEGDTDADEAPATSVSEEGPQQFAPSPSFQGRDRPKVRLVELPAWLQSFASSVGEPEESPAPPAPDKRNLEHSMEPIETDDIENQDAEPHSAAPAADPSSSSFISEDDLPEWLRAIAPEGDSENSTGLLFGSGESSTALDDSEITVPNVSRAWSNSKDARGTDEATSLFALVASQAPQAALPSDGTPDQLAGQGRQRPGSDRRGTDELVLEPSSQDPLTSDAVADNQDATSSKAALPMLPVAVGAIFLLILLAAALVLFVL